MANEFAIDPATDARKRWALLQLKAAGDSSPVGHPLAALARALQGMAGGYIAGQADREESAAWDNAIKTYPGMQNAGATAPATPNEPPAATQQPQPMTATEPRGIRNNNPGNIEDGPFARRMPGYTGGDGRFAQFASAENGQTAMDSLLASYGSRGINNVSGVINRWAPPSDNNPTSAYAATVAKGMGIDPNAPIDLSDPAVRAKVSAGIAQFENGRPVQMAQAGQPMPQAQGATSAPGRASTAIPQEVRDYVLATGKNKATRALAIKALELYGKPTDQFSPITDAGGNVIGQQSSLTREAKTDPRTPAEAIRIVNEMYAQPTRYGFKGADDPALHEAARHRLSGQSTNVSINNVANPVLEGVGKQIVDQRKSAMAATTTIPLIHDARRLLDEGMTTGQFADGRVMMQKVGALFGMSADEASNTETFLSVIGNEVLAHIKQLGANPSNTDRDYIEKIQGGKIALEEKSLRRILDIGEKYARQSLSNFNRDAKKLMEANPDAYRGIAPLMTFDEPPAYQGAATAPAQPLQQPGSAPQVDPAAVEQEMRRRRLLK